MERSRGIQEEVVTAAAGSAPAKEWLTADLLYPIALTLLAMLITFIFGVSGYVAFEKKVPQESWMALWNRWDAVHFLDLAEHGYEPAVHGRENLIALLPGYPLAIRAVHLVVRNWHAAALLVSNVCAIAAAAVLFKLVRVDYGAATARRATLFFVLFPTAYFLHAAYSESLFLFATIGAFYFARQQKWLLAGCLGTLATATRIPGIVILPPLVLEYLQQRNFRWREIRWDAAWLAVVPVGAMSYLAINYKWFGDPLHFLAAQERVWGTYLRWPWPAIAGNWYGLTHGTATERVVQYGGPFFAFLLATGATIAAPFLVRPAYALYTALSFILIFFNNFPVSSPRYLLAVFPIFVLLARIARAPWLRDGLVFVSVLFYALFTMHFVRGWWAF